MVTAHDYSLACARESLVHRSGTSCPGPSWRRCGPCASSMYGPAKGSVLAAASLSSLRLLKKVATFTAVSDYLANRLSPIIGQFAGQRIDTLHSFVPDGLYESGWQAERPEFLPAEDGYLLYVGQLSRYKGVDVLIDAYRRLPSPPPLVMLGTPHPPLRLLSPSPAGVTMRTSVAHQVRHRCHGAGCLRGSSVGGARRHSRYGQRSQNCGVPVIASVVGGVPGKSLDGRTGWLVPAADERASARTSRRVARQRRPGPGDGSGWATARAAVHRLQACGTGLFEETLEMTSQAAC